MHRCDTGPSDKAPVGNRKTCSDLEPAANGKPNKAPPFPGGYTMHNMSDAGPFLVYTYINNVGGVSEHRCPVWSVWLTWNLTGGLFGRKLVFQEWGKGN